MELHGNLKGLGRHETKRLKSLHRRRLPTDRLISPELARELTEISRELGRQVGLLFDRAGHVAVVLVGDDESVEIPDLGRQRTGPGRLLGLRLVHSHLKGETLTRDDLTDLQALRLDSIAAIVAIDDGMVGDVHVAWLVAPNPQGQKYQQQTFRDAGRVDVDPSELVATLEAEMARTVSARHEVGDGDTTVLVVLDMPGDADLQDRVHELKEIGPAAKRICSS